MNHTPRPWNVGISVDHTYGQSWPVFRLELLGDPNPGSKEVQANRRLIEAAPDLLEALRIVHDVNWGHHWYIPGPVFAKVVTAIAKATGKEAP